MNRRYLGPTIDLHCGGQDLIFPHHENEIAQSECANGCTFANYWMHNGYINIDNKKMSKSLGNFFTAREVAEQYGYEVIRYMMVQAHYRSPADFSNEALQAAEKGLSRLMPAVIPWIGQSLRRSPAKLHRRRQRRLPSARNSLSLPWMTTSTPQTA